MPMERILWEKIAPNAVNIKNRIVKRLLARYGGKFRSNNTVYVPPTDLRSDQILRIAEEERKRIDIKDAYFKLN
jgi:hypothetical protein